MKKKILVTLITIVCIFVAAVCSGCGSETENVEFNKVGYDSSIAVYVDEETGVNYILYDGYNSGGITPRYNPDGSLYVKGN